MYKKFIVLLICLFVVGNSAQGVVLCVGADGHIEIESAFHECCDDLVRFQLTERNRFSSQVDHEKGEHCGPCIDIPISIGMATIFRTPEKLNSTFEVPATNVIVVSDEVNFSAYNSTSNTFAATSYFTPLSTVILLV